MEPQEKLTAWLKDAYAMEKSMEETLEHHIKDAQDFPDLRDRLEQHLRETRDHAARVSACLESLEEESSPIKEAAAHTAGLAQSVPTARLADGVMQNVLRDYAGEHFEIACYTALRAAAQEAEYSEIARHCTEILAEEQAMAAWLVDQIPEVTQAYLERATAQA